jgi:hypothetical protein
MSTPPGSPSPRAVGVLDGTDDRHTAELDVVDHVDTADVVGERVGALEVRLFVRRSGLGDTWLQQPGDHDRGQQKTT